MSVFTKDATQIADALGAFSRSLSSKAPQAETDAAVDDMFSAGMAKALKLLSVVKDGKMGFSAFTNLLPGDGVVAATDLAREGWISLDSGGADVVVSLTDQGRDKVSIG